MLAKGLAIDIGRHVVEQSQRVAGVEQGEDQWVLKRCEILDLAQESLGGGGVAGVETEGRDGNEAIVLQVRDQIYARHGAVAERADGDVAAGERDLELLGDEVSRSSSPVDSARNVNVKACCDTVIVRLAAPINVVAYIRAGQ